MSDLTALVEAWDKVREQGWVAIVFVIGLLAMSLTAIATWRRCLNAYKGFAGHFAEELAQANQQHNATIQKLTNSHELHLDEFKKRIVAYDSKIEKYESTVKTELERSEIAHGKLQWIKKRYNSAIKERIWLEAPRRDVPEFVPLDEFKTPIISVFNLKGGVGKTTISANLAATYWERGERILLIDLDYQASLTTQCLTNQQIYDLDFLKKVRCVLDLPSLKFAHSSTSPSAEDDFLAEDGPSLEEDSELFDSMLQSIGSGKSFLFPTSDALDAVEQRQLIQLAFGQTDVRFNLRRILHSPSFINRFDRIIIDCPPRLTSGSVNALASSHFVLVPVLPDVLSTAAAPKLVKRLEDFKKKGICPHLKMLGIVANKAHDSTGLSTRQVNRWNDLKSWLPGQYFFDTFIPERVAAGGNDMGTAYSVPASLKSHFEQLAREVDGRINSHAGL